MDRVVGVELHGPPVLEPGQKVRALTDIRNDGTFPGAARGETIVEAGDVGYVRSVGTFLQRYYVYGVDFIDRGRLVGMRVHELEVIEV